MYILSLAHLFLAIFYWRVIWWKIVIGSELHENLYKFQVLVYVMDERIGLLDRYSPWPIAGTPQICGGLKGKTIRDWDASSIQNGHCEKASCPFWFMFINTIHDRFAHTIFTIFISLTSAIAVRMGQCKNRRLKCMVEADISILNSSTLKPLTWSLKMHDDP